MRRVTFISCLYINGLHNLCKSGFSLENCYTTLNPTHYFHVLASTSVSASSAKWYTKVQEQGVK